MRYLNLTSEIKQSDYEAILKWALEHCTQFSLTWRTEWEVEDTANKLYQELLPFFIREEDTDEWPGTKIFDETATVAFYNLTDKSKEILSKIHLFNFEMPLYPEDLAIYKENGDCWFGSVAHEQMAFFMDPFLTSVDIKAHLPNIDVDIFEE